MPRALWGWERRVFLGVLLLVGAARGMVAGVGGDGSLDSDSLRSAIRALNLQREQAQAQGFQQFIGGDGQPENIGYGYQRTRAVHPSYPGLLMSSWDLGDQGLNEPSVMTQPSNFRERMTYKRNSPVQEQEVSSFRERIAARQRRQREREHQRQINDFAGLVNPGGRSPVPPDPELSDAFLQAMREAWARYQQQTGTIDVGPDDLTHQGTLQILDALEADQPVSLSRPARSSGSPYGALAPAPAAVQPVQQQPEVASSPKIHSLWDWYNLPNGYGGMPLRKRSVGDDYQVWREDAYVEDPKSDRMSEDDADGDEGMSGPERLAMILFDDRYVDPGDRQRLILSKRSLSSRSRSALFGSGVGQQGMPMRRRKKSADTDPRVQEDLAHIFGESESEPEAPRALPLASATSTTTAAPLEAEHGPMNPIGLAHEADQLARNHEHAGHDREHAGHDHERAGHEHAGHDHATHDYDLAGHDHADHGHTTESPEKHENAPPMVAAEGPHSHDHTIHVGVEKQESKTGEAEEASDVHEEPRTMELRLPSLRVAKKSINWHDYIGIDKRKVSLRAPSPFQHHIRKKSATEADKARINEDWLVNHTRQAISNSVMKEKIIRPTMPPETFDESCYKFVADFQECLKDYYQPPRTKLCATFRQISRCNFKERDRMRCEDYEVLQDLDKLRHWCREHPANKDSRCLPYEHLSNIILESTFEETFYCQLYLNSHKKHLELFFVA